MNTQKLRLLVVDDDEDDFMLVHDLLRESAVLEHAPTIEHALRRIADNRYDLMLFDYRLGRESGLDLLKMVRQRGIDTPIIFLTGRGDEEVAVEALKLGASDYMVKSKLNESALERAVSYAIRSHHDAKLLLEAQAKLRASEEKIRALIENISDTVVVLDGAGVVQYANARGALGYNETENLGRSGFELLHPEDMERVRQLYLDCVRSSSGKAYAEFRVRHKDGSWLTVEATAVNHLTHPAINGIIVSYHDVTERKRAQQEIEAARIKFETIVRSSPDPIALLSLPEGRYIEVNDAFLAFYGYDREEVIGNTALELGVRRDPEAWRSQIEEFQNGGRGTDTDVSVWTKSGEARIVQFAAGMIQFHDQSCVLTVTRDVTERKRAEEALQLSDQIVRRAGALILTCNSRGQVAYVSDSVKQVLGYEPEEVLGVNWWSKALPEADGREIQALLAKTARGEMAPAHEPYTRKLRCKDGSERWIVWYDTKGPGDLVIGIGHDITALKQAEAALTSANEQLSMLLGSLPVAVYRADPTAGYTTFISGQVKEICGFSPEQFVANDRFWFEHIHPDDRKLTEEAIRRTLEEGAWTYEYRFLCADGKYRWMLDSARLVRSSGEKKDYVVGTWLQIDDRKRAEETLRLQGTALEAAANAIVITDNQGTIIWVNPAFERLTGYSSAEAVGQSPRVLKSGEQPSEFYERLWGTIVDGRVWQGELVNRRKDGTTYLEEMTITPLRNADGSIQNFIGIKQDVTEHRRLREQLASSQRMEAVGRLSGGVAHDFNNILGVILGYSELLAEKISELDPLHKYVEQIHRSCERAASLTRQLLAFSRQQHLQPVVLNLNSVVSEMDKMLHRLIGEDVDIQCRLAPDLASIRADRSQVEQIIMNLGVNARDAMPEGGRLTIETSNCILDETYAQLHNGVEPAPYVMLAVTDTGAGMSKQVQEHIFEPFFTTKAAGKGTGLGLATVYGIVQQSGGHIWVYSEPGKGTSFKVYLPAVGVPAENLAGRAPESKLRGSECILLVEDSLPLRELTRDLLASSGYTVLEAEGGEQAQEIAASSSWPIDLLITDVVMPGMSGPQLAERLQAAHPHLHVLYISGYTDHAVLQRGPLDQGAPFLQKPYTREALGRKVREVLNEAKVETTV